MSNKQLIEIAERNALIDCISRYGGKCRDCADNFGICEHSGLPCDPRKARKAIAHVLQAGDYYAANPQHVVDAAMIRATKAGASVRED